MKIQSKLFLAFLLGSLVLVSAMYGLTQWSFDRGMLDYINQRELNAQASLADALAVQYEQQGSWQFIRNNHRLWRQLLESADTQSSDSQPHPSPGNHRFRPPPPHREGGPNGRPPPRDHLPKDHFRKDQAPRNHSPRGTPPPPRPPAVILLDQNQQPIFGRYNPKQDTPLLPITVAGNTVGWLTIPPRENMTKGFDLSFVKQQQTAFLVISGILLLLSICVAYPLAVLLTRPIKKLAQATHQLTSGNYQLQVDYQSHDELGQLTQDFNHLARTLAANETARKRWIADISHELRTPLAITRGELEAMLDGVRPIDNKSIVSTHQEILHLQRLVDDLYELTNADIGALNYQLETTDVAELVQDQVNKIQHQAKQAGLTLTAVIPESPVWLEADETRLAQLITNLLTNSIKYTDPDGQVQVSLTDDKHHALIQIEDSSPGVADKDFPHLFDPLFRVESSRNRKTGGSGLGLAICEKIVAGHNGSIEADSSALGGLRIKVRLPKD